MAFALYLAMTAGEIAAADTLPRRLCYMACHFSAYGTGLSNIPRELPKGSVLILNDRMSIHGHDPEVISRQLQDAVRELDAEAVLLDLQQPKNPQSSQIVSAVIGALSCPVAVSEGYAAELSCPVFLPPPPVNCPLEDYITPWQGRQIWLEASLDAQQITVTSQGCQSQLLPGWAAPEEGHEDRLLHCHYSIDLSPQQAQFTLWRTPEDLAAFLEKTASLGIDRAIGLHQELGKHFSKL